MAGFCDVPGRGLFGVVCDCGTVLMLADPATPVGEPAVGALTPESVLWVLAAALPAGPAAASFA